MAGNESDTSDYYWLVDCSNVISQSIWDDGLMRKLFPVPQVIKNFF